MHLVYLVLFLLTTTLFIVVCLILFNTSHFEILSVSFRQFALNFKTRFLGTISSSHLLGDVQFPISPTQKHQQIHPLDPSPSINHQKKHIPERRRVTSVQALEVVEVNFPSGSSFWPSRQPGMQFGFLEGRGEDGSKKITRHARFNQQMFFGNLYILHGW